MKSKILLVVLTFGITFPCRSIDGDYLRNILANAIFINGAGTLAYNSYKFTKGSLSQKTVMASAVSFVGCWLLFEAYKMKKEAINTGFLGDDLLLNKADNYLYASGIISAIGTGSLIYLSNK